jgi:Uma2 family endonuclease
MVTIGKAITLTEIAFRLGYWNRYKRLNGRVTTGNGVFHFDDGNAKQSCTMPDVAYSTNLHQQLSKSLWTYKEEPFSPLFVCEVDTLADAHPRLGETDAKMKIYFEQGVVRLAWAIDPENKIMYVYHNDAVGMPPIRSQDSTWRDLDGGDILPGFVLYKKLLNRAIS